MGHTSMTKIMWVYKSWFRRSHEVIRLCNYSAHMGKWMWWLYQPACHNSEDDHLTFRLWWQDWRSFYSECVCVTMMKQLFSFQKCLLSYQSMTSPVRQCHVSFLPDVDETHENVTIFRNRSHYVLGYVDLVSIYNPVITCN